MTGKQYAVALGFFDGVHLAHRWVLGAARRYADEHGLEAAALTFDRHPGGAVAGVRVPLLQTNDERRAALLASGMDRVFLLPFDDTLRHMPWSAFLSDILCAHVGAAFAAVGYNYRFGMDGQGDPCALRRFCRERGLGCAVVGRTCVGGQPVSSTLIRSLVARGEVETARLFLGRPPSLSGTVEHGKALGRTIGLPTMNFSASPELCVPAEGVYITRTRIGGAYFPSMTNVSDRTAVFGEPPCRPGEPASRFAGPSCRFAGRSLETHALCYDGDAYGQEIRVEFLRRLRGMTHFRSAGALRAQLAADRRAVGLFFDYGLENTPGVKERNEWDV